MFGSWGAIPIGQHDGDGPKPFSNIKQHSGPLTFPVYHSPQNRTPDSTFACPETEKSFYSWFQKIRRVTDVTKDHLDSLNLTVEMDVPIHQIIPDASFLPKDEDEVFSERSRELLLDNKTAYEVLSRIRRDVKLGHMFKFYQTVEMMAPYYDPSPVVDTSGAMEIDSESLPTPDSPSNNNGKRPVSPSARDPGTPKKAHTDSDGSPSPPPASTSTSIETSAAASEGSAKPGDKTEDEKFSVPERFREDLVRNFMEPLCWTYGVRVYPPRAPPKVNFQRSRFAVHMTNHIYLTAPLPADARAGICEGPVLGMQVRHEHDFRRVADPNAALKKRRKKLMSLGVGAPKPAPAAEPAKKRRSSSSKAAKEEAPQKVLGEIIEPDEEAEIYTDGLLSGDGEDIIGITRELVAMISLVQHRARPAGEMEKKVRAHAVGMVPGADSDTVFLLTGMHHHIAVSALKVTRGYLRWLRTGKFRGGEGKGQPREGGWEVLELKKTRYWSLLVPEERREAARAVMGVMGWCTRPEARHL